MFRRSKEKHDHNTDLRAMPVVGNGISPGTFVMPKRKSGHDDNMNQGNMRVFRRSKFTEHFDISMTDTDTELHGLTAPCPSSDFQLSKSSETYRAEHPRPLTPIEGSVSPSQANEPSTPLSKLTAQQLHASPTSLYSRATSDSKPFASTSEAELSKKAGAYFVFHDGKDTCDTRVLFENSTVKAIVLVAAMQVLTGEASAADVGYVNRHRSTLPRYRAYSETHGYSFREDIEEDVWLRNQKVWAKRGYAVAKKEEWVSVCTYVGNSAQYPDIGFEDGEENKQPRGKKEEPLAHDYDFWDEVEPSGMAFRNRIKDDGHKEEPRGRSRSSHRATAARSIQRW